MKTLTVKREGTSTEFSYEIVWDGSYERLAGCVENLKLSAKRPALSQTARFQNCIWKR